ncbi:hypothetical protein [Streptomyces viridosporus]|uniref:hypothetical protein n=1 Tax=Streptomyces viridosporus TaxID=67581 RepID=UPI0036F81253
MTTYHSAHTSIALRQHPAYRNILTNGARIVDEWLPVKDWPTAAVLKWHQDAPMPHHWTYDSFPGAGDFKGTSRCSCSLCVFASKRDLLLAIARRPRLAALYAEVESARGDSFRPDWRITDLIEQSRLPPPPASSCRTTVPTWTCWSGRSAPPCNSRRAKPSTSPPGRPPARPAAAALQAPPPPTFLPSPFREAY